MGYLDKMFSTTWKSIASQSARIKPLLLKRGSFPFPLVHRCKFCGKVMNRDEPQSSSTPSIVELSERGLLQVAGTDAANLLQGLITNDMEMLGGENKMRAMYTMFLNAQVIKAMGTTFANVQKVFLHD